MIIFLVGYMGSGKSYWGQEWATAHNLEFIDLDDLIEETEQKSISEIFETKGEAYFRQLESKLLKTCSLQNTLIACGGGTPCFDDNMQWMNETGVTVFLDASPTYLMKNIIKDSAKRPLINNNKLDMICFIEEQLQKRMPVYLQAAFVLNSETLQVDSLHSIIQKMKV